MTPSFRAAFGSRWKLKNERVVQINWQCLTPIARTLPKVTSAFSVNLERAMGIEQIRMNRTKALPRVPHFNWSQMESSYAKSYDSPVADVKIGKLGWCGSM
jgi:hypothetical protein